MIRPGIITHEVADQLNAALERLAALENIHGSSPINVSRDRSGVVVSYSANDPFPAILGVSSGIVYAWQEATPAQTGSWAVKPGGRVGTTTNQPAYSQAGDSTLPAGTQVWLHPWYFDPTLNQTFLFDTPAADLATKTPPVVLYSDDWEEPVLFYPQPSNVVVPNTPPVVLYNDDWEDAIAQPPGGPISLKMPGGWSVTGSPASPGGGFAVTDPLTTKGDQLANTGTSDARFPCGTNGQVEITDSSTSTGLNWNDLFDYSSGSAPNLTLKSSALGGGGGYGPWGGGSQKMYGTNCTSANNKCYYIAGSMYYSGTFLQETMAGGLVENLWAVPFMTPGGTIAELAIQIWNIGSSSPAFKSRMGIYANHSTLLYPTTLLADFGEYGPNNSPPNMIIHNATTFTAKFGTLYWLVLTMDWDTINSLSMPTYFDNTALPPMQAFETGESWNSSQQGYGWFYNGATYDPNSALPGTFPGSTTAANVSVLRSSDPSLICPCMGYYFSS